MLLVGSRKVIMRFVIFSLMFIVAVIYVLQKRPYVDSGSFPGPAGRSEEAVTAIAQMSDATKDFYIESRLERERIRSRELDSLEEIGGNPNIQSEIRQTAGKRYLEITENARKESEAETLIKARGYADALVFIQGDTVLAMVKADRLEPPDVARIGDIISRTTGIAILNITVVARP